MALDETLHRLLDDVMRRRTPRLRRMADPEGAGDAELDEVCQALNDEFVEAGFGPDGLANPRGVLLEKLIEELAGTLMRRSRARH